MRILSLNTAGRLKKQPLQLAAIQSLNVDVLCLQEVIPSTLKVFKAELPKSGFNYLIDNSFEDPGLHEGPRKYCLLTASKQPIKKLAHLHPVGWQEKFLRVQLSINEKMIEIAQTHIPPGSSNKWVKIETIRAVYKNIVSSKAPYKILCGDFNTPMLEMPDGSVITWGQSFNSKMEVYVRKGKQEWDRVERSILKGLEDFQMIDCLRHLHGYQTEAFSFVLKRKNKEFKRRFDHMFASEALPLTACRYIHEFRKKKWSDHSGLLGEFDI